MKLGKLSLEKENLKVSWDETNYMDRSKTREDKGKAVHVPKQALCLYGGMEAKLNTLLTLVGKVFLR
jgi:hypothetical protein